MIASTVTVSCTWVTKSRMRLDPGRRISGPASIMTRWLRRSGCATAKASELIAPIEVMKPHPPDMEFMALRQYHLAKAETGPHGGRGKVLAIFLRRQAHGDSGSFGNLRKALARKPRRPIILRCSRGMRPRHAA